jgi:hypothetical protein
MNRITSIVVGAAAYVVCCEAGGSFGLCIIVTIAANLAMYAILENGSKANG